MKSVMGVKGAIAENDLGLTLPHEHLFADLSCYWNKKVFNSNKGHYYKKITPGIRDEVAGNPWAFIDNIVLNDLAIAIEETAAFQTAGGKTIADLAPFPGMGRNPRGLLTVSETTGVNILMSAGRYSEPSMTEAEKRLTIEDIEKRVLDEFINGVEGSGIKPGLLKTGFVAQLNRESELRSLRAVGRVQNAVGCALSVHPHIWEPDSHLILDILEEEGCDLRRVILCHQDFLGGELDYLQSIVDRGPSIEFDTFGSGLIDDPMWRMDEETKLDNLVAQVERGNTSHLLISGDMFMKIMLTCGGGNGLANIPGKTLPALLARGVDPEVLNSIVVENPRRVFCH